MVFVAEFGPGGGGILVFGVSCFVFSVSCVVLGVGCFGFE